MVWMNSLPTQTTKDKRWHLNYNIKGPSPMEKWKTLTTLTLYIGDNREYKTYSYEEIKQ